MGIPIWIFRRCRGVRYRRTSCRSVGGRRFSTGALNSDGSELGYDFHRVVTVLGH